MTKCKLRMLDLVREEAKRLTEAPVQTATGVMSPEQQSAAQQLAQQAAQQTQPAGRELRLFQRPPYNPQNPEIIDPYDEPLYPVPDYSKISDYSGPTSPPPLPGQSSGLPAGYQTQVSPADLAMAQMYQPSAEKYIDPRTTDPYSALGVQTPDQRVQGQLQNLTPPAQQPSMPGQTIPNFPAYQRGGEPQGHYAGVPGMSPEAQLPNLQSISPAYTADPGSGHLPAGDVPYSLPPQPGQFMAQWPPTSALQEPGAYMPQQPPPLPQQMAAAPPTVPDYQLGAQRAQQQDPVKDDLDLELPKLSEIFGTLEKGPEMGSIR